MSILHQAPRLTGDIVERRARLPSLTIETRKLFTIVESSALTPNLADVESDHGWMVPKDISGLVRSNNL